MSRRINIRASQAAVASNLVGPFIRIVPYTARLYLLRRSTFPISAIIATRIYTAQLPIAATANWSLAGQPAHAVQAVAVLSFADTFGFSNPHIGNSPRCAAAVAPPCDGRSFP